MIAHDDANLLEALSESRIYQDYERAFTEATGLPVALRPVESWQLPHHNRRNENRFCALMATKSKACAACLQVQAKLAEAAADGPCTLNCELGLVDTAVPVKLGEKLIGFLQTGQIFQKRPTESQFDKAAKRVAEWGIGLSREELKDAYYSGKVLTTKQYESMVKLLTIFAQHISMVSNQIALRQQNSEPPSEAVQWLEWCRKERVNPEGAILLVTDPEHENAPAASVACEFLEGVARSANLQFFASPACAHPAHSHGEVGAFQNSVVGEAVLHSSRHECWGLNE